VGARKDGRDLIAEWKAGRPVSVFVRSCAELDDLKSAKPTRLLGLFAPGHLRYEADRAEVIS